MYHDRGVIKVQWMARWLWRSRMWSLPEGNSWTTLKADIAKSHCEVSTSIHLLWHVEFLPKDLVLKDMLLCKKYMILWRMPLPMLLRLLRVRVRVRIRVRKIQFLGTVSANNITFKMRKEHVVAKPSNRTNCRDFSDAWTLYALSTFSATWVFWASPITRISRCLE